MSRLQYYTTKIYGLIILCCGLGIAALLCCILLVLGGMHGTAVFPADCALVFGSAIRVHNQAGPAMRRRVGTAVALYKEGNVRTLILTGGFGEGNQQSEAAVMHRLARSSGVPEGDLYTEDRSRSTWENIAFSAPLLEHHCDSVVAVSDRYHLARIRQLAWMQGITLSTHPADLILHPWYEIRPIVRDALGIGYYWLWWMIHV